MSTKRSRMHKRRIKKSGKAVYTDKIYDPRTGTVIIINSSDPKLKLMVYKRKR